MGKISLFYYQLKYVWTLRNKDRLIKTLSPQAQLYFFLPNSSTSSLSQCREMGLGLILNFCYLTVLRWSSMGFPQGVVSSGHILLLLHYGLFQRPQGNLCSGACGTSSLPLSHLGGVRAASLTCFSPLFLCSIFSPFFHAFPKVSRPSCGSATPCGGRLDPAGTGWNWACPAGAAPASHRRAPQPPPGAWAPTPCTASMIQADNTAVHRNL